MELRLTDGVKNILSRLEAGGFSAFVAGGAVRDLLAGRTPHDYDIATNALPGEIKAIFSKTIDTGIKHGTVTVIEKHIGYEVTTFRRESTYSDGRHPDSVEFVNDIREDCARRDFTINSMMYSPTIGLVDYFGGRDDIEKKIIRCVGDSEMRFREDALRMLRAVRFAAVMSFELDSNLKDALKKCAPLIRNVSNERILGELNKILLSPNPDYIRILHEFGLLAYILPELERCFGEPQRNKYHIYDVGEHTMYTVKNTPPDIIVRWAALLHDVGKPCCSSIDPNGTIHFYGHHHESCRITEDALHRLRMDSDSIRDISVLVENHDVRIEPSFASVKRMMSKTGKELFEKLLLVQTADNMAKNKKHLPEKLQKIDAVYSVYREVLAEKQPYLVSHLVVNGRDLLKIGYKAGREIGDTLKALINEVIINPQLNNREYLMERATEMKRRKR